MFEGLTERLAGVFDRLSGRGVLTEKDVDEAMREVARSADGLAVAQHGDPVGQAEDLFQPVRDIDDADALLAQTAERDEEGLGLGLRKRAGGLVQY